MASVGKAEEAIVQNALEKMDIAHLANRSLNELSGGQRQRALVARALVQDADVYLLDEPFVGIDVASEAQIMDALRDLRDAGKTIIIVHHDLSKVANYFDSVILLNHGLLRQGKPEDVMDAATLSEAYGDHQVSWIVIITSHKEVNMSALLAFFHALGEHTFLQNALIAGAMIGFNRQYYWCIVASCKVLL